MQQVVSFVERNPGLYMRAAAHYVNPCPVPEKAESYGYNTVHRVIDAGLVRCERDNRGVRLYPLSESHPCPECGHEMVPSKCSPQFSTWYVCLSPACDSE
jgi:predicted RNA-binding Zn-ribbon protein involved in translation (DUF1610 family)